jgi:hypothetical protein
MRSAVGGELAAQVAGVHDALEAGDDATARAEAEALLAAVESAIAAGDVPGALADDLRAGAEQLLAVLPAPEPAPPPEETKKKKRDKHDKPPKGKKAGKDKKGKP